MRSLVATTSMSPPDATMARKKLRPMRPKPLIPTRTVTAVHLFGETVSDEMPDLGPRRCDLDHGPPSCVAQRGLASVSARGGSDERRRRGAQLSSMSAV